jgi:hypothetical protein
MCKMNGWGKNFKKVTWGSFVQKQKRTFFIFFYILISMKVSNNPPLPPLYSIDSELRQSQFFEKLLKVKIRSWKVNTLMSTNL